MRTTAARLHSMKEANQRNEQRIDEANDDTVYMIYDTVVEMYYSGTQFSNGIAIPRFVSYPEGAKHFKSKLAAVRTCRQLDLCIVVKDTFKGGECL